MPGSDIGLSAHLNTAVVEPLTSVSTCPFRVPTKFQSNEGVAAIDQLRTIDKRRLVARIRAFSSVELNAMLDALVGMFSH